MRQLHRIPMLVAKREVERNLVVEFLVNADFLKKFRADADPLRRVGELRRGLEGMCEQR